MQVRLSDLKPGEIAVIEEVALPESERQLLMRFGFHDGTEVRCSRRRPLETPSFIPWTVQKLPSALKPHARFSEHGLSRSQ